MGKKKVKIEFEIDDSKIKVRGQSFRPGHVHKVKTKYTRKKKHKKGVSFGG
jgi:hypothetical protein